MKNKRGATSGVMVIGIILLVAMIGVIAYLAIGQNISTPKIDKTGVACGDNEPYISNGTFNEYAKGTGVGVAYSYILNGEGSARTLTTGSSGTKFAVGDKLKILSSASSYLDTVEDFTITKCGSNDFTNYVYAGDAITLTVLDQNLNTLTDASIGGAVNVTSSANPTNVVIRLDGAVDKSTGQMLLTLESNDTEVSEMSISAKSVGAKVIESDANKYANLKLFVAEGTAPTLKQAFVVDAILDGGQADYNIRIVPESGKTLGGGTLTGAVYVNAYAGEWFIDDDGTLKFGWEDSDGTLKYEQKATDYDFLIE